MDRLGAELAKMRAALTRLEARVDNLEGSAERMAQYVGLKDAVHLKFYQTATDWEGDWATDETITATPLPPAWQELPY